MTAALLSEPVETPTLAELLRPDPLPEGGEPEARVVYYGLSWERYLAIDRELGEDRPGPRLYYLDGALEFMTTSREHERIRMYVGDLLHLYFEAQEIDAIPCGQATIRLKLKEAGAEPDHSWVLGADKECPDLVFEVALTSGGLPKLKIYQQFGVPEVWFWREGRLEVFALDRTVQRYEPVTASRLLPMLDLAHLEKCAKMTSFLQARRAFRAGLNV